MIEVVEEELRLVELFRQKAEAKHYEMAMRLLDQHDEEQKRREKMKLRKEEEERKLIEAIATNEQLAAFSEHLDDYDTATIHALMDNQRDLDRVVQQQEMMDAAAYRLPDGRMAYKTEDGRRVFDQHGVQLGPETAHPDTIPDTAPTWEANRRVKGEVADLRRERDQLHAYQERLDAAREAGSKRGVTGDALDKMDADLRQSMPDAVKARLPGAAADRAAPAVQEEFAPAANRPTAVPARMIAGP